ASPSGQQQSPDYVPGELLIKFHPAASDFRRNNALAARGARVIRRFAAIDVHHVQLPQGQSVEAAVAALSANPDVVFVQPNCIRRAVTGPPNDPFWTNGTLWGLQKIQALSAWTNFTTGDGSIVIADIDTGINYNHPDLAANVWTNPGEIP